MLKKRIIGTITILNGHAVQSFGYKKYLPIGHPKYLAENLDRWGVDEILLLDIKRSAKSEGPNICLLKEISSLGLATPIIYGGGINSKRNAIEAIKNGADRLVVDTLLTDSLEEIKNISMALGAQALIGAYPLSVKNEQLLHYQHLDKTERQLNTLSQKALGGKYISEYLIIDWKHEGYGDNFDVNLINLLDDLPISLIAFGGVGVGKKAEYLIQKHNISAIAIGNEFNYQEFALQTLRTKIKNLSIRKSVYSK